MKKTEMVRLKFLRGKKGKENLINLNHMVCFFAFVFSFVFVFLFFGVIVLWNEHVVIELLLFHLFVSRCVSFVPLVVYVISEETCVCVSK